MQRDARRTRSMRTLVWKGPSAAATHRLNVAGGLGFRPCSTAASKRRLILAGPRPNRVPAPHPGHRPLADRAAHELSKRSAGASALPRRYGRVAEPTDGDLSFEGPTLVRPHQERCLCVPDRSEPSRDVWKPERAVREDALGWYSVDQQEANVGSAH
jgi:hypothetical protein